LRTSQEEHIPLDPNKLPHRRSDLKPRKPITDPKEFKKLFPQNQQSSLSRGTVLSSILGIGTAYAQEDPIDPNLAETIEVQFTQEIQDLAASLDHDPVKIYEWVRNNIEFVPTYGSIQGAHMTLLTKQGNAFDISSLLIALLRVSDIKARYVYGTIELPIDKVMNWVGGFTDEKSAADFIASGGVPVSAGISGGKITDIWMEHVWVEAFVDYIPSRGAVHKEGDTWIPMDGSFKQYEYTAGLDIAKNITFNKQSYLSTFNDITPVEFYSNQIQTYLDANLPGKTIEDVKRTRKIQTKTPGILAATVPYKIMANLATLSGLTDTFRYKVSIAIPDLSGNSLAYTVSLPEIMAKRLTISYVPSASADEDLIKQYGGFYNVPAYLIMLKPAVKIEGVIMSSGMAVTAGTEQELAVSFIYPGGTQLDRVTHTLKVGGYYALGLSHKGTLGDLLEQRFERYKNTPFEDYPDPYNDPLTGELLFMDVLRYLRNVEETAAEFAEVSHYAYGTGISEGLMADNINVSYVYGMPYKIEPSSTLIDAKRKISILMPLDGDYSKRTEMMNLLGMTTSVLEHQTLEEVTSNRSISAVKAIQLANEMGIPIHFINQSNLAQEVAALSVPEEVKESIIDAVNQGKVVTIPETNLQYNLWYGVGWMVEDPETGAGAYMISGYLMGGETTEKKKGVNPYCFELTLFLGFGVDVYRAIAYQESRWAQFNNQNEPLEGSTHDYGVMQINKTQWKGNKWPLSETPVDWDKVLWDWAYNVNLGKEIYDSGRSWAEDDLENAGIENPTEEQLRLSMLSRYNAWEPYYGEDGERNEHAGCDYADIVNDIYKTKPWTDSNNLNCRTLF